LLRGKDVQELKELQRQGMSIQAISELTGWDRKTIRKYMQAAGVVPEYGPRRAQPSKLDAFKPYLEERLRAGVWNARVLLRELRERNYTGSYTILTDWLRPQRSSARVVAVRRFETAPGKQAQVDWGHLGTLEMAGKEQKLHGFTFTLGYSRRMVAEAALDQKLGTLLRLHEAAFQQIGGGIHSFGKKDVGTRIVIVEADLAGNQDRRSLWRPVLNSGDQLRAIEAGHGHVGDDQIDPSLLEARERVFPAAEAGHAISPRLQHNLAVRQGLLVVIDTKNRAFWFHQAFRNPAAHPAQPLEAFLENNVQSEMDAKRKRRCCKVPSKLMEPSGY